MPTERFVTLGLARVRTLWFSDVSRWATSGAVLIMAFLGAAMWVAFSAMWDSTSEKTQNQVEVIGGNEG